MSEAKLVRVFHPTIGIILGVLQDETIYDIREEFDCLSDWLRASAGRADEAITELIDHAENAARTFNITKFENAPVADQPHWLAPIDEQDVWAAGVTYKRSREARQEEAIDGGDIYARVYDAERPEIFFKARGESVIGPLGEVGIREDATWNVPEPELALLLNPHMEVVGFSIGNDMSSRDIEGDNPLYLPQAKVYTASCAIGPGILLKHSDAWLQTSIQLTIKRHDDVAFNGQIHTSQIKRTITELTTYLGRSNHFPNGAVLLTGTGVVPPGDFTLQAGDVVAISIDGIGTLQNTVKVV